ncbi:MAG TPA: heparan-alpha-glucosaminide N-acetyltransferase domain-containing protein [Bacteroidota bacterium]|nr:heparan-alpha-glucosaminide N-acetyltransferase domain-containing protein [Bacteroidota bacterium]
MNETTPVQTPAPRVSARFEFIDLLRGWAVFVMIETHVYNALLRPDLKDQGVFKVLTFINGLVAPAFLFCAGVALAIVLRKRWEDHKSLRKPFWKYLFRLLFILIVGYSLHLPFFSLSRLRGITDPNVWLPFFQADILQTIAVGLFILTLLIPILRNRKAVVWCTVLLTLFVIYFSPVIRNLDYSGAPQWLSPYFTMQVKSQFPLFPWMAFLSVGTLIGFWFLGMKEKGRERAFVNQSLALAVVAIVGSLVAEVLPITIYPDLNFWNASPQFFFVRCGIVVGALDLLWLYENRRTVSQNSVITLFGKESLLVYCVHLLIVYGYTYKWSFVRYFGPQLNYLECFMLFAALTAVMWVMAFCWFRLKRWNIRIAKVVEIVTLGIIVLTFLLRSE